MRLRLITHRCARMHPHRHAHIHTHTYARAHTHTHTHAHTNVIARTHSHTCACCAVLCAHVHMCAWCVCVRAYMCINVCSCLYRLLFRENISGKIFPAKKCINLKCNNTCCFTLRVNFRSRLQMHDLRTFLTRFFNFYFRHHATNQ